MRRLKKIAICCLLILASLEVYQLLSESTSFTSSMAHLLFKDNFHEVIPGELYRAAEMKSSDLADIVEKNGVKTIIDLRLNPNSVPETYRGEKETVEQKGAEYIHFPIMGSKEMSQQQVKDLLQTLDDAQPPLLIHCSSGTHRSGVVAAIYLMEKYGLPYDEAIKQMSGRYGFILAERKLKSFFQGKPTIDNILWRYGAVQEAEKISFHDWVMNGMKTSGELRPANGDSGIKNNQ